MFIIYFDGVFKDIKKLYDRAYENTLKYESMGEPTLENICGLSSSPITHFTEACTSK